MFRHSLRFPRLHDISRSAVLALMMATLVSATAFTAAPASAEPLSTESPVDIIAGISGNSSACPTDGVLATSTTFKNPWDAAQDRFGNIYVSDIDCRRVYKIDPFGFIHSFAGSGTAGNVSDSGTASTAPLTMPVGLAVTATDLYISDQGNYATSGVPAGSETGFVVIKVNLRTGQYTRYAGTGAYGLSGDGGPATAAKFQQPSGIAVDAQGNLYLADYRGKNVRYVDATTGNISTIKTFSSGPRGVAFDPEGNVIVAVADDNKVYRYSPTGVQLGIVAAFGSGTDTLPEGVATDAAGNVYISTRGSNGTYGQTIHMLPADGSKTFGAATRLTASSGGCSVGATMGASQVYYPWLMHTSFSGQSLLVALGGCGVVARYGPPSLENGSFESGDLTSWKGDLSNSSAASWVVNETGTAACNSESHVPTDGAFVAHWEQNVAGNASWGILSQRFGVPQGGKLSFSYAYTSSAAWNRVAGSETDTSLNQWLRLDVIKASANVQTLDPSDILATIFDSQVGSQPLTETWTAVTQSLSSYAGQRVAVRAFVVSSACLPVWLDDFRITGSGASSPATVKAPNGGHTFATAPSVLGAATGYVTADSTTAVTFDSAPNCAVYETASAATSLPLSSTTPAGAYVTKCDGGAAAGYSLDTYETGTYTVSKASPVISYVGAAPLALLGTSITLSSTLSIGACTGAETYTVSPNPLTGTGSATYNRGAISTSGWLTGAYTISANYPGDANCNASTDASGTLVIASPGDAAYGGGWSTLSGGKFNFGFQAAAQPKTTPTAYKGQLVWVAKNCYRFKGTISSYVKATLSGVPTGIVSGTGSLSWWNSALNGGLGGWERASSLVSFSAAFQATTNTNKKTVAGAFGISINFTPTGSQPALPTSSPITLKGGSIKLS